MRRDEFVSAFNKANDTFNIQKANELLSKSIAFYDNKSIPKSGDYDIIVAIEEMAELQKELSKWYRGKPDLTALVEEIGDVLLSILYVQHICGISKKDIYKAMNVKLDRMERRISNGDEIGITKEAEREEKTNEDL